MRRFQIIGSVLASACGLALFALVLWTGGDDGSAGVARLGLVRSPAVLAAKLGEEDDGEGRANTIQERDDYWRLRLGDVPQGYLTRLKKETEAVPTFAPDKDGGIPTWTWLGPGNIGGRIRAMIIDPANPQRMWTGGVSGGIWKSTNGGGSWSPINDFMANLAVCSMAITPDRQYLFAGTGEGFSGGFVYAGEGVFRSGDLGQTWQQMPIPNATNFQYINRIAVHPTIDGRLYVVTGNGVLYRSDDDGMNWSIDLYLGALGYDVKITNATADGTPWIFVGGFKEAFLSTDDGTSFTSVVNGPVAAPLPADTGRVEVAFGTNGAGNDSYLYASLKRNNGELWRSLDKGNTWTQQNTGSNIFLSEKNQGDYDNALWVEPGNPSRIIWGGVDLYDSFNGGLSFARASNWRQYHTGLSAHSDQHLILPHPNYNGTTVKTIYFGNDGGLQSNSDIWNNSTVAGWTNLANGLGVTQFYQGAAAPDGSLVMGGAQDNSFLRYANFGSSESWYQAQTGDGGYCAVNPLDKTKVYASTQKLSLYRSTDSGTSYTYIGKYIPDVVVGNRALFIAPFTLDKANPDFLFAGTKSIWHSTDMGDSWTAIRDSLVSTSRCSAIEQANSDLQRIYVGYVDGTVSRSYGSSPDWVDLNVGSGMPAKFVNDIAVNPVDDDDVIVALSTFSGLALWRSFNAGASWTCISNTGSVPLPDGPINTVTFHPVSPHWIYVGTDAGVFASEDGGNTWNRSTGYPGSEGPANTKVSDLFWAGDNLYAATYGRGMWVTRPLVNLYIDAANTGSGSQDGSFLDPYGTVSAGETGAGHGTNVYITGGTYDEPGGIVLDKRGLIRGRNGSVVVK